MTHNNGVLPGEHTSGKLRKYLCSKNMKRIGLIVNPIAGLGGRVGLKGSDGLEIQQRAIELGASPRASDRTTEALKCMLFMKPDIDILTSPGSMGEIAVAQAGFFPHMVDAFQARPTTAEDTRRAVNEMLQEDLSLLMFTGGDGTARDIYSICGTEIPVLGIPAGVKIQSAVYAIHPRAAGELAATYLQSKAQLKLAEVVDLDEEAYRQGRVSPRLYGYLQVPYVKRYIQGVKVSSTMISSDCLKGIAEDISEKIEPGTIYIFGPGSTTQAIAMHLGMDKNLLGVDAYLDGKLIAPDANESVLLKILASNQPVKIIVTPIGGQGSILGRGNQQISPNVIRKVGKGDILVVCTKEKLDAFKGRPLWVDTGDYELDKTLSGYLPIITGYKDYVMYKITS
jgi:predicted polyphosphate/ATP-dependent NAD kinase